MRLLSPVPIMSLPALDLDPSSLTFVGMSGGAYMAHQMHIIYSERIKGVGLMMGGPYYTQFRGHNSLSLIDDEVMNKTYSKIALYEK